jgi:hypothetical protein
MLTQIHSIYSPTVSTSWGIPKLERRNILARLIAIIGTPLGEPSAPKNT